MTTFKAPPLSLPQLVRAHDVPLVTGQWVPYTHFDYAATTPALAQVWEEVTIAARTYGSVHRGGGWPADLCTQRLAQARVFLATFVGAGPDDVVVFTRNTTDALSLLARALPARTHVVHLLSEHHANMLPWRAGQVTCLPLPPEAGLMPELVAQALSRLPAGPRLVALSAASNVTGELLPVAEVAQVARQLGARVVVDAAQLAAHRILDMTRLQVDYVALSGHKMYAPLGAGALIGRRDWLDAAPPYLPGGGAARVVRSDDQDWALSPARHEGGTPNLLGILALSAAAHALTEYGLERVAAHEMVLNKALRSGLAGLPGVQLLRLWQNQPSLGVVSFTADGVRPELIPAVLSAEHGMGLRAGSFCAHPLVAHLLARRAGSAARPQGAVRASVGLGSTLQDVQRLVTALESILLGGPLWRYRVVDGHVEPDRDPRLGMAAGV